MADDGGMSLIWGTRGFSIGVADRVVICYVVPAAEPVQAIILDNLGQ